MAPGTQAEDPPGPLAGIPVRHRFPLWTAPLFRRVGSLQPWGAKMKTLTIRWQRLVAEGGTCPRCGATEVEIEKAASALSRSLNPLGIEVVLEKSELSVAEFEDGPLESNHTWLNGRSLEDWLGGEVGQSPCCHVCGPNDCRTIQVGWEVHETVPADLIVRAGPLAAARLAGPTASRSCRGEAVVTTVKDKCFPK